MLIEAHPRDKPQPQPTDWRVQWLARLPCLRFEILVFSASQPYTFQAIFVFIQSLYIWLQELQLLHLHRVCTIQCKNAWEGTGSCCVEGAKALGAGTLSWTSKTPCRLQHKWLLCAQQTLLKATQTICMVFRLTSSNWFVNQSNIWPTNGLFCWNKKWVLGLEDLSFLYQKSHKFLESNHWHKNICLTLSAKLKVYTTNGHMFK